MRTRPKILLVCSSGGHLLQMKRLADSAFVDTDYIWVCLPSADSKSMLKFEKVIWAFGPTNRNYWNLFRNLCLAPFVLIKERPKYIISTGAGVAIPFLLLGRVFGMKVIFVESFARQSELSLTGKFAYRIANLFIVQNPELAKQFPKAIYAGVVY